jgi:hypothetical protein
MEFVVATETSSLFRIPANPDPGPYRISRIPKKLYSVSKDFPRTIQDVHPVAENVRTVMVHAISVPVHDHSVTEYVRTVTVQAYTVTVRTLALAVHPPTVTVHSRPVTEYTRTVAGRDHGAGGLFQQYSIPVDIYFAISFCTLKIIATYFNSCSEIHCWLTP